MGTPCGNPALSGVYKRIHGIYAFILSGLCARIHDIYSYSPAATLQALKTDMVWEVGISFLFSTYLPQGKSGNKKKIRQWQLAFTTQPPSRSKASLSIHIIPSLFKSISQFNPPFSYEIYYKFCTHIPRKTFPDFGLWKSPVGRIQSAVCVGCLFLWTPSRVPYGTPLACANRAAYPDPPPP